MGGAGDDHCGSVKERLGIHGRAPQDLACQPGFTFARMKLPPNGRVDTIGSDQQIGFIDHAFAGPAVAEPSNDPGSTLLESHKAKAAPEVVAADTLAHGPQKDLLQI